MVVALRHLIGSQALVLAIERMPMGCTPPVSARDNSSTKLTMLDKLVTYTGISCLGDGQPRKVCDFFDVLTG